MVPYLYIAGSVAAVLTFGWICIHAYLLIRVIRDEKRLEIEKDLRARIAIEHDEQVRQIELDALRIDNMERIARAYHSARSAGFQPIRKGEGWAYLDGNQVVGYQMPAIQSEQLLNKPEEFAHENAETPVFRGDSVDFDFFENSENRLLLETRDYQRLLISGGSGTGKTSLIQNIINDRINRGYQCVVCDPKPYEADKWPCKWVGASRDWDSIQNVMESINAEMTRREKEFNRISEMQYLSLVVDELYVTGLNIAVMDYILPLLCYGREFRIGVIVGTQSKTAGSMGMKGKYDLNENYDGVIELVKNGGKRTAVMDGKEYPHPGPFNGHAENSETPKQRSANTRNSVYGLPESVFNDWQSEALRLLQSGVSKREIAKRLRMTGPKYETLRLFFERCGI